MNKVITENHLNSALSYSDYVSLVDKLLSEGKTTGSNHSQKMIDYTKMNQQRRKRLDKTVVINKELNNLLNSVTGHWTWLVLSEAWCGDVAQNIPVLAKMASLNDNIDFKLLLRDENPEVMEAYLTNGSRSIPKLICLDSSLNEIGSWGPRPKPAQQMVMAYKSNPTVSYEDFIKEIQLWYAKDKTQTIQKEFTDLLKRWNQ